MEAYGEADPRIAANAHRITEEASALGRSPVGVSIRYGELGEGNRSTSYDTPRIFLTVEGAVYEVSAFEATDLAGRLLTAIGRTMEQGDA